MGVSAWVGSVWVCLWVGGRDSVLDVEEFMSKIPGVSSVSELGVWADVGAETTYTITRLVLSIHQFRRVCLYMCLCRGCLFARVCLWLRRSSIT